MGLAYPIQKLQDWITQQWVISRGKKIIPDNVPWLMGPFGNIGGIGEDFIKQLAEKEKLVIERNVKSQGLISSIDVLNLSNTELSELSQEVIAFYENTAGHNLSFTIKWNPVFKFCGILINRLFSNRIRQLNIPTKNIKNSSSITSEIITLSDPVLNEVIYTIWFRTIQSTGQVVYSGVYGVCQLPSGKMCVKAVFPLPKGNATVIMLPSVGENGELILDSSGKRFGDAGFYFLLTDSKGNYWSKYVSSFRDRLTIGKGNEYMMAEQVLTLWHKRVLQLNYKIKLKTEVVNVLSE